jgi:hypothetical protein
MFGSYSDGVHVASVANCSSYLSQLTNNPSAGKLVYIIRFGDLVPVAAIGRNYPTGFRKKHNCAGDRMIA